MTPKELESALRNIGPKVATQLINAGIDSPEKLKQMGSKKAFLQIMASGSFSGCFNAAYLYALEEAILDCDWRDIPDQKKRECKEFTAELREQFS